MDKIGDRCMTVLGGSDTNAPEKMPYSRESTMTNPTMLPVT